MLYLRQNRLHAEGKNLYVKKKKYKLKIRFVVSAQEAKAVAPLSSTLGQFGLNCPEFCKKFNESSVKFEAGVPLTVYLDILFDRTFRFKIYGIDFSELMSVIADEGNYLLLENFYKLAMLHSKRFHISVGSSIKILLGVIRASSLMLVLPCDH